MITLDSQNRLAVNENLRKISNLDFQKEVRIFLQTKNNTSYMILSNERDLELPCFGIVNFNNKFRFTVPKDLRMHLNLTQETTLLMYCMQGNLIIQKM